MPASEPGSSWIDAALATYQGPLLGYAERLTGDPETARDIVQDTFLRLCKQEEADVAGHLAQWLYTVCRNRALDLKRKEHDVSVMTDTVAERLPSGEPGLAALAERHDETGAVLRAIAALPERQQEVLRLKFAGGLAYKEIAEVLQISTSNVGFLIHTALNAVRRQLEAQPAAPASTAPATQTTRGNA